MRFLSSWPQYLATTDDDGIQIHQFATGEVRALGRRRDRCGSRPRPAYPWDGARHGDRPRDAGASRGRCRCGSPAWCRVGQRSGAAGRRRRCRLAAVRQVERDADLAGRRRARRSTLDMPVRVTAPDARVDAVAGLRGAGARAARLLHRDAPTCRPASALEDVELGRRPRRSPVPRPDLADDGRSGSPSRVRRVSPGDGDGPGRRSRSAPSPTSPGRTGRSRRCASGSPRPVRRRRSSDAGDRRPTPASQPASPAVAGRPGLRGGAVDWRTTSVGSKTRDAGARARPSGRARARSRARRSRGRSRRSASAASSGRAPCGRRGGGRRSRRPTARRGRSAPRLYAACRTPTATRSVEVTTAVGGSASSSRARSAASPPASELSTTWT